MNDLSIEEDARNPSTTTNTMTTYSGIWEGVFVFFNLFFFLRRISRTAHFFH